MKNTQADQYNTVERVKQIASSIRACTRPIKGHTDPESIFDCWNELNFVADTLFSAIEVKRMLFRVAEIASIQHKNNPDRITSLHINYEQIMDNKGLVVNMAKDH